MSHAVARAVAAMIVVSQPRPAARDRVPVRVMPRDGRGPLGQHGCPDGLRSRVRAAVLALDPGPPR